MTSSRTKALLSRLTRERDTEVERQVLRLFGASSAEQCLLTYETAGAAERESIDRALESMMARVSPALWNSVDPEPLLPRPIDVAAVQDELDSAFIGKPSSHAASEMRSYRISRRYLSIGRSYSVEDTVGARVFGIAGKIGFARAFSIQDTRGNQLLSVREKLLGLDPTFVISREAAEVAVVKRTTTARAVSERYEIAVEGGGRLRGSGSLLHGDGVTLLRGDARVGMVRRQQSTIKERFFVDLAASDDQALLLAIAMSIVEIEPDRGNAD
jgi:uncharacterized protein YxjI